MPGMRDLKAGLAEAGSAIFEVYDKLRELLTEQDLFDQLIQIAVGPRWAVPGTIDQLLQYGLIREAQVGKDRQYRGWSEHFQAYLERWRRAMCPSGRSGRKPNGRCATSLRTFAWRNTERTG